MVTSLHVWHLGKGSCTSQHEYCARTFFQFYNMTKHAHSNAYNIFSEGCLTYLVCRST